ncbi:uncharacterized protein LOC114529229 [Dendronephthya gigantea]|uniref:uncharacterized protein LOC114529229 n=1 Tax=Dendronephthya gigantea TaxID=151771 RepID=UPI00106C6410|nr:uncharacterized protein LOC114529229 [Dendronephthya gigantea]
MAELTTLSDTNILICSRYRPPNADKIWMESFENFLNDVRSRYPKIVLAGDFNLPHACWNSKEPSTGMNKKKFIEILKDFYLEQLNEVPTRKNNILDLVITSIPDKINMSEVLKPTDAGISTDHSACLGNLNLHEKITENGNINQDWSAWKNTFLTAVAECVPVKKLKGRRFLPWMNNTILHLIKKKNTLRMKIKKSCFPSDHLKTKSKSLHTTIKQMLRDNRLEYLNSICASRNYNPKHFWSFFKLKSKVRNIPGKVSTKINERERKHVDSYSDIANMFNEYFASVLTPQFVSDILEHRGYTYNTITMQDITLSEAEVIAVILNLDSNKAQGPDNISPRLLKETAIQIGPSLCSPFNKSLQIGVVPSDWKLSNVVPVYKYGEKSYVEHFRPISLLSLQSSSTLHL